MSAPVVVDVVAVVAAAAAAVDIDIGIDAAAAAAVVVRRQTPLDRGVESRSQSRDRG